jgi:hypothetical protein
MRAQLLMAGFLATTLGCVWAQSEPAPTLPAGQLVREVVFNELNDHARHGYWRYWVEHRTATGTRVEDQVETSQGPLTRLAENNGRPLDPQARQQEQARLTHLLNSPQEQAKHLQQYTEDEQRIGRILALLPDAFLYDYDGFENGCYRMRFRPNPAFPPHSIEARVFHAMVGEVWINADYKRLTRLEGRVGENVDFGFGILGRLYKGGWFKLVRTQVSSSDWKTAELEVHMSIRALLVKTFARETSEERGGFTQVPAGLSLSQAMHLQEQSTISMPVSSSPAPAVSSVAVQTAVLPPGH